MHEIMLADHKWHPCTIIGKSAALDYDGWRVNVVLDSPATVTEEGKKAYTLSKGFKFFECHSDCIRQRTQQAGTARP